MRKKLFLETTIQIDRYYHVKSERKKINEMLKNNFLITSSYVLGEFQYNLVYDTITYHHLLCDPANETPMEALVRLSKYSGFKPRMNNRVHKMLSSITTGLDTKEEVKARVELLIDRIFIKRFMNVDQYLDQTSCIRAKPLIIKKGETYQFIKNCRSVPRPDCDIANFLKEHRDEVKVVGSLNEPESIVKGLHRMLNMPYGRNCWSSGDAVISMEMPEDSYMYTTNTKDFAPLCKALNKNIYHT